MNLINQVQYKPCRTPFITMTNKILSCILFFILNLSLFANNQFSFVHYGKDNSGLSHNGIRAIITDRQGYVWIATYKGLTRFDGSRFKVYDRSDFGVDSDYISSIAQDPNGNIWIGTDNGIIIYDKSGDRFTTLAEWSGTLGVNDRIFSIIYDGEGGMLVGTKESGLYSCDLKQRSMKPVTLFYPSGKEVMNFYRLAIDKDKRLYVAVYCDNLYTLEPGSNILHPLSCNPSFYKNDDIEGLVIVRNSPNGETIYVASKKYGLSSIEHDKITPYIISMREGDRPVGLSPRGNDLWMSATDGLHHYNAINKKTEIIHNIPGNRFSLSESYVTTTHADEFGRLFVGTLNSGINLFHRKNDLFQRFNMTDNGTSLEKSMVNNFAEDKYGNVWIATGNRGLLRLSPDGLLTRVNGEGIPDKITALCDGEDLLWAGTQNGIVSIRYADKKIKQYPLPRKTEAADNRIVSLFRSSDGKVYAATALGVLEYIPDTDQFESINRLNNLTIEHMAEENNGNIWMASYSDGVFRYNPSTEELLHFHSHGRNPEMPQMISSVCIAGGKIWVLSYSSGLLLYNEKSKSFSIINKSKLSSLPTDIFFSGISDNQGNLWLSSADGLVKLNPKNNVVKVFKPSDGILDAGFNKCAIKLRDGSLIFGSENGFIRFNPSDFNAYGKVQLSISGFYINGKEVKGSDTFRNVDFSDELTLAPEENSFSFLFATPFNHSSDYEGIFCKLEGYDTTWQDITSSKKIEYKNIPHGSYRLIFSSDINGSKQTVHKPLTIIIKPRFFESAIGIIVVIFTGLAIIALIYFVFIPIIKKRRPKGDATEVKTVITQDQPIASDETKHDETNVSEVHAGIVEDFQIPDIDKDFIIRLDKAIADNLEDSTFSSVKLEGILYLSHSTLNRRIKALFDTTPNEYIKSKRLAVAAKMLSDGNMRVNEICRAVGIPSPSYFSKCFKERYGMLPLEYRACKR